MKNSTIKKQVTALPQSPGVYLFKDNKENVLYIGKAKNLQKRVKSHFQKNKSWFWNFVPEIKEIEFFTTQSEKEALLLELELIKKIKPKYNIQWRDDKSYIGVSVSKEDYPRVYLSHQKNAEYFGPYTKGSELKKFLREIRKILPYRTCKALPKKPCLYYQLDLCIAPCIIKKKKQYQKLIKALKIFLKIYAGKNIRIEGYDISNISGTLATGSMVVFKNNKPKKIDYRKFKIKKVKGQNDVKSLREILLRRLKHKEWQDPDLILLDGGKGQLNAGKNFDYPIVALAKIKRSSGKLYSPFSKNPVLIDNLPEEIKNLFLKVRDEAHRFAISYHKKRRTKKYGF
jgi:excinuclease UvrABC nuclease subunit